jgi:hypothetical protein
MDGWLELLSTIEKRSETGPPDRKCRILFSDLQLDRRKLDERKLVGGELVVVRCARRHWETGRVGLIIYRMPKRGAR